MNSFRDLLWEQTADFHTWGTCDTKQRCADSNKTSRSDYKDEETIRLNRVEHLKSEVQITSIWCYL